MRCDTDRVPSLFWFPADPVEGCRGADSPPIPRTPGEAGLPSEPLPTPAPMVLPIAQAVPSLFGGSMLPLFAALFLVMYFTMIRPQAKAAKAHRALVEGLAKGDRVVTQGGLHGTITRVDETTVVMSVEDGTRLRVERSRVAVVLAKDAPKEAAVSVN